MTREELQRLEALLRVPSVSAVPGHEPDMERAAAMVAAEIRRAGGEAEVRATPRHPLVVGEVPASHTLPAGAPATVVVRPEDVELTDAATSRLRGTVIDTYFLGGASTISIEVPELSAPILASVHGATRIHRGDAVGLRFGRAAVVAGDAAASTDDAAAATARPAADAAGDAPAARFAAFSVACFAVVLAGVIDPPGVRWWAGRGVLGSGWVQAWAMRTRLPDGSRKAQSRAPHGCETGSCRTSAPDARTCSNVASRSSDLKMAACSEPLVTSDSSSSPSACERPPWGCDRTMSTSCPRPSWWLSSGTR